MNILEKNYETWLRLQQYLPFCTDDFYKNLSAVLFDLNVEKMTFMDIIETVKYYKRELDENETIEWINDYRGIISKIDPIFFQEYYKEQTGWETTDYQGQADQGAILFCENFIYDLYGQMRKDELINEN